MGRRITGFIKIFIYIYAYVVKSQQVYGALAKEVSRQVKSKGGHPSPYSAAPYLIIFYSNANLFSLQDMPWSVNHSISHSFIVM